MYSVSTKKLLSILWHICYVDEDKKEDRKYMLSVRRETNTIIWGTNTYKPRIQIWEREEQGPAENISSLHNPFHSCRICILSTFE